MRMRMRIFFWWESFFIISYNGLTTLTYRIVMVWSCRGDLGCTDKLRFSNIYRKSAQIFEFWIDSAFVTVSRKQWHKYCYFVHLINLKGIDVTCLKFEKQPRNIRSKWIVRYFERKTMSTQSRWFIRIHTGVTKYRLPYAGKAICRYLRCSCSTKRKSRGSIISSLSRNRSRNDAFFFFYHIFISLHHSLQSLQIINKDC